MSNGKLNLYEIIEDVYLKLESQDKEIIDLKLELDKFKNLVNSCSDTFNNTIQERFQDDETDTDSKIINVAKKNSAIAISIASASDSSNPNKKSNIGMIVGSVTGGVVLIGLILFLVLKKQRKFKKKSQLKPKSQIKPKSQLNKKGKKGKK